VSRVDWKVPLFYFKFSLYHCTTKIITMFYLNHRIEQFFQYLPIAYFIAASLIYAGYIFLLLFVKKSEEAKWIYRSSLREILQATLYFLSIFLTFLP
jgi:hypothetical protein